MHPSAQTRTEILQWRASHPGLTCRQIGARFGVSGLTVHRVLLTEAPDELPPARAAEQPNAARTFFDILRDRSRAVRQAFNIDDFAEAVQNRTDRLVS